MQKDLSNENYLGIVVYNNDPDFSGRCKVRVYGLLDDDVNLPDDKLPWFAPVNSNVFGTNGAGSISVPKIGSLVRIRFANEDIYSGEYTAIQKLDSDMINEIKADYPNTQVLLYDAENMISIIYQVNSGLKIYYAGSYIQIAPDNLITLCHSNNTGIIQIADGKINIIGNDNVTITSNNDVNINCNTCSLNAAAVNVGKSSLQPAVLGNELIAVLTKMATIISTKYPTTPGIPDPTTFGSILSNTIKVSK